MPSLPTFLLSLLTEPNSLGPPYSTYFRNTHTPVAQRSVARSVPWLLVSGTWEGAWHPLGSRRGDFSGVVREALGGESHLLEKLEAYFLLSFPRAAQIMGTLSFSWVPKERGYFSDEGSAESK